MMIDSLLKESSRAVAVVIAVMPMATTTGAETIANAPHKAGSVTAYAKHSGYYGDQEPYFGNWGFAPGGYYWRPNYMWRRSRGFWDTNSPACPFRFC
jgi:hypothetical protein